MPGFTVTLLPSLVASSLLWPSAHRGWQAFQQKHGIAHQALRLTTEPLTAAKPVLSVPSFIVHWRKLPDTEICALFAFHHCLMPLFLKFFFNACFIAYSDLNGSKQSFKLQGPTDTFKKIIWMIACTICFIVKTCQKYFLIFSS